MSDVDHLVQEGIAAIKAGDKALGRGKLEAAVKQDQYNEEAWLWLAKVVTTEEEKRTCLGNVIIINPQNKEAQRMLDRLEGKQAQDEEARRAILGLSPRNALIAGGAIVIIFILGFVLLGLLGGGGDEVAALPTELNTNTPTPTPDDNQTATAQASITPSLTLTPTLTAVVLPPTWTPTLAASATPLPAQFGPPPDDLPGRIIMQSGNVAGDPDNQPIVVVEAGNLDNIQLVSVEGQRGQNPALLANQRRFAWAQFQTGSRTWTIQIQGFSQVNSTNVVTIYDNDPPMDRHNFPQWSDNRLTFAAQALGTQGRDIWLLDIPALAPEATTVPFGAELTATPTLTATIPTPTPTVTPEGAVGEDTTGAEAEGETVGEAPSSEGDADIPVIQTLPVIRLTNDGNENTWPAFDPTGTAVVFVSEAQGVTDLNVVNTNSLQVFVLTTNGNQIIESAPDWATTSGEIVFSGLAEGGENSDIYLMSADGSAEPTVLIDLGGNEIQPRFSPDDAYIVFSSDVNGSWDVFIYDREEETYYTLIDAQPSIDIANDWTN